MKKGTVIVVLVFAALVVLPMTASAWGFARSQAPSVCAQDIAAHCPVAGAPAPDFRVLLGLCVSMLNACHENRIENPGFFPSCSPKVIAFCIDACPESSLCSRIH
jgi:hypothetical protein